MLSSRPMDWSWRENQERSNEDKHVCVNHNCAFHTWNLHGLMSW